MPHTNPTSEPLTRQACEQCRRKKTKCTGEKPICSFCQRLNIECSYLPRGSSHANRVAKRSSVNSALDRGTTPAISQDRFRRLELQVSDLYSILGSSHRQSDEHVSPFLNVGSESPSRAPPNTNRQQLTPIDSCDFTVAKPEPPIDVLRHFVHVYGTKLHSQPLLLFRLKNLTENLLAGPRHLLWSFLALLLTVSSHEFYGDKHSNAEEFYARTSNDVVTQLVGDGVSTPEVIQSLCLIALRHIKTRNHARAWMSIGNALRLYSLRTMRYSAPVSGDSPISRGYWTAFLLERLFLPSVPEVSSADTPAYPDSPPLPPPVVGSAPLNPTGPTEASNRDIGVNEYCLRMMCTWGKIRSYLHRLRQGETEKPWLSDSTHTQLIIELIEFESQLCRQHLFTNVEFPKRTAEEVNKYREYWDPWITTQVVWHAAQAILSHPFLHLIVLRKQVGNPQSSLFLQQKADHALYHTGWVFQLIQSGQDLLEITNPLIGEVVAATATVSWLYQFSKDLKVAQKSRENLDLCEGFLNNMALMWPHIFQKLNILRKLQAHAEGNPPQTSSGDATISFKPAWFWDLLDPRIPQVSGDESPDPSSIPASDSDSVMCLREHFVQPLRDGDANPEQQPLEQGSDSFDSFFLDHDNLELFSIDNLSRDFLQDSFWNKA